MTDFYISQPRPGETVYLLNPTIEFHKKKSRLHAISHWSNTFVKLRYRCQKNLTKNSQSFSGSYRRKINPAVNNNDFFNKFCRLQ